MINGAWISLTYFQTCATMKWRFFLFCTPPPTTTFPLDTSINRRFAYYSKILPCIKKRVLFFLICTSRQVTFGSHLMVKDFHPKKETFLKLCCKNSHMITPDSWKAETTHPMCCYPHLQSSQIYNDLPFDLLEWNSSILPFSLALKLLWQCVSSRKAASWITVEMLEWRTGRHFAPVCIPKSFVLLF